MKVSKCIMGKFALILIFFNSSLILFYFVMYTKGRVDTKMNNLRLSQILDNQDSHQSDVIPTRGKSPNAIDVQIGRRHINGLFKNVSGSFDGFGQRSLKHDDTENPKTKTVINRNKFLVYLCNKQKLCGGWGVRQAGIISTFLLANLTNRIFKVSMTSPCKLQHFLIPNQLNWIPDIEELRGKSLSVIHDVHNSTFLDILRWKNFNIYYSQDIVFVRATMDFTGILTQNPVYIKQVSKITTQPSATFKDNWNMLMAPSIQTQTVLQDILALNNRSISKYEDLICAHVKLGSDPPTEDVQNILQILQQWTRTNPKTHQEIIYQEYQATKHREKSSQLQQYYEQIVSKTQTELTTLKSHLKVAKKDLDGMKRKHGELAERLTERSRQYQKLQSLYESLRRRCITPASFNGGGDASMIDQTANRLQNFTMNLTTGDVLRGQNSSTQGSKGQSPPERDFVFRPNNTPLLAEQSRFSLMLGTPK